MTATMSRYAGGFARQATAMVAGLGGTTVLLRMPAAAAGEDGEQLGLNVPLFADMLLGPVAFRKATKLTELLVPGAVLELALGVAGETAVREALGSVAMVVAGDDAFAVTAVDAVQEFGRAYLYVLGCLPERG